MYSNLLILLLMDSFQFFIIQTVLQQTFLPLTKHVWRFPFDV